MNISESFDGVVHDNFIIAMTKLERTRGRQVVIFMGYVRMQYERVVRERELTNSCA